MSEVIALLIQCRDLEAELTPTPEGNLRVTAPARLPDEIRHNLKQRKAEVVARVTAMNWLRSRLVTPRRMASLIVTWVAQGNPRSVDALMDARWVLGVEAYVGKDGRFWWRLPRLGMQ